jgi:PAS domain S-box-containing protein
MDYKELFKQAPFALLLCSTATSTVDDRGRKKFSGGELVAFNDAFAEIIGYSPKEIRDGSFLGLTPKKYSDAEAEVLENLEKHGCFGPYEKEYYHKDGHLVPIRLHGKNVSIGGKKYIWSVIQEISTDEVEVFNKAPFGILLYRASDGEIIHANYAFAEKLGYTVSQVRERHMRHLIGQPAWDQGQPLREIMIGPDCRHVQSDHKQFIAKDLENQFAASVQGRSMKVRGEDCIWELVDWLPDNPLRVEPGTVDPFEDLPPSPLG